MLFFFFAQATRKTKDAPQGGSRLFVEGGGGGGGGGEGEGV